MERVKELEFETKRKSRKILLLQERNLDSQIVGPGIKILASMLYYFVVKLAC